jgi:SAM-dependent methyltransferase
MVQEYSGHELQTSADLKTSACCCSASAPSAAAQHALELIPQEILDRYYGCGSPLPPDLEGKTVLDLGCGTGRDVYVASYLVGEAGQVIGVDMTPEQLEVARRYQAQMAAAFGYATSNVKFLEGYIEDLSALGLAANSVDVVISNCVINLSPAKPAVLGEVQRVLRPGGELYFSDVFASQPIPTALANDPVLRGECLGGALDIATFEQLMQAAGFANVRYVETTPLTVDNPTLADKLAGIHFTSRTVQAFKDGGTANCCSTTSASQNAGSSCCCG